MSEWCHCNEMIDCLTSCFEGFFTEPNDSSERVSEGVAQMGGMDSSCYNLLESERVSERVSEGVVEMQRREQIERYTREDLLYKHKHKQPVLCTREDTSEDGPECVMW